MNSNIRTLKIIIAALAIAFAVLSCRIIPNDNNFNAPYAQKYSLGWMTSAKNQQLPSSIYPYVRHADLSPAGVAYSGYNDSRLNAILDEMDRYTTRADFSVPVEIALPLVYDSLGEEMDHLKSQYALIDEDSMRDVNDTDAAKESARVMACYMKDYDRCNIAVRNVLNGPYGSILKKKIGRDKTNYFLDYEDLTDQQTRLLAREKELTQEYQNLSTTNDDLSLISNKLGRLYLELVKTRNQLALASGYESYAEYSYSEFYNRDYSPEDAARYGNDVKKYIVPLYIELSAKNDAARPVKSSHNVKGDKILKEIAPFIKDIDPELMTAYNYMTRNDLIDLDYSPDRYDTGYTENIPEYRAPFIFNTPYRNYQDYTTIVHEFGHYNNMFHAACSVLGDEDSCYDVAEIHSQGLELLFTEYYDELFGEDADSIRTEEMLFWMSAIVGGCQYDEFQRIVYDHPDMTPKELNRLCVKLNREYGQFKSGKTNAADAPYEWLSITHNFDSPMYYISYSTSMFAAMEIYVDSLNSREAAIGEYMKTTAVSPDTGFVETLKNSDLDNPFDSGIVEKVSRQLRSALL